MMPAHAPTPPAHQRRAAQPGDLLPLGDWVRHHSLRSWPVLLFLVLICVPSIALVSLGPSPSPARFDVVAWIFAAYFALAWLLLLGVIVQPEHVTRPMLVVVTAIALVTQVPLALALETALHASNLSLGRSVFTIGVPEELAKAVPVLVVALIYRSRQNLQPRDYLFVGAVSGLVFGASEVVRYFTVNGVAEFYLTVKAAIPTIARLIDTGHSGTASVFATLIGPVLYFILDFVWRFLTDPITHACWSGLTGYFIGLAATGRHKWYTVGWIGLVIAAILHGLNDWSLVSGHVAWVLVVLVSGILFLGYAKVGARSGLRFAEGEAPPFLVPHETATHHEPVPPGRAAARPVEARSGPPPVAGSAAGRRGRPWWEH
jgi:RsiW-degrading membrane proteinase PrsW (M82 family)